MAGNKLAVLRNHLLNGDFSSAKDVISSLKADTTIASQLVVLELCVYAMENPIRHPKELKLNQDQKRLLLEIRHRTFGYVFPTFNLSYERKSLFSFLPRGWLRNIDCVWDFLDVLRHPSAMGEFSIPYCDSYESMVPKLTQNEFRVLISQLKDQWRDLPEVVFYYSWAAASLLKSVDGCREVIRGSRVLPKFCEAQAENLISLYLQGKVDIYGLHNSIAFCEASVTAVLNLDFERLSIPQRTAWVLIEILKRCNRVDEVYALYLKAGRPEAIQIKVLIATAYQYGYLDSRVTTVAKERSDSIATKMKAVTRHQGISKKTKTFKVTLMTADIGNHAVSYFLSTLFLNYQRHGCELNLITNFDLQENTPGRADMFAKLATSCVSVFGVDSQAAAQIVSESKPNIILEMNGLLAGSRYDAIPLKGSVPIVHYLGGQSTTNGLADYFLCDDTLNASDCLCGQFTEDLVSLEHWMCYQPSVFRDPDYSEFVVKKNPRLQKVIVIGFFNWLTKCGVRTKAAMLRLLEGIPNSKILIGHGSNSSYDFYRFLAWFPVDYRSRFIFDPRRLSWEKHMMRISVCDVVLDALDYVSGGTSTCDAISIGVPVISTADSRNTFAERMTLSILRSAGLSDMVRNNAPEATDALSVIEQYNDQHALMEYVRSSDLCNMKRHSCNLFDTLKKLAK